MNKHCNYLPKFIHVYLTLGKVDFHLRLLAKTHHGCGHRCNELLPLKPRDSKWQGWKNQLLKPKDSALFQLHYHVVKILKDLHPLHPRLQSNKQTSPKKDTFFSMGFKCCDPIKVRREKTVQITVISSVFKISQFSATSTSSSFQPKTGLRMSEVLLEWRPVLFSQSSLFGKNCRLPVFFRDRWGSAICPLF